MSTDADKARELAEIAARSTPSGAYRDIDETEAVLHDAEHAVMRRLVCAARGIEEAHYWWLVEREIRK